MIDSSYAWLAAKYIRRQAKQLARQFDGVRAADDTEFIHRARVACRRLRAALRTFDNLFAHKRLRRWNKEIRRTAAILGDARDHDVQIDFLCNTQSALSAKECCLGVARVLVELERDRERLQPSVIAAVDRLESKRVLRQLRRAAKALRHGAGSSVENAPSPAAQVKTRQHILRRLEKLLQRAGSLADADDQQGHHAMRIAAKRFRYTVEIARPVFPGRLDETLECMKKVQSLLGDVHDCDVWAGQLDAFSARQCGRITRLFGNPGRMARLQPGIDYLRRDRRRRREETFEQLVNYWAELEYRRLWENLRSIDHLHEVDRTSRQPHLTAGS